ncbi:MAG TPA: hypothetical protein VKK81_20215, partial [Candidatus Binatia bacterium]|nr:hypothetical protein [Candidatus Binatia bacterium]
MQQALVRLAKQCADELVFFGLTDIATWTAKACPLAEGLTQAAQVEKFQTALLRYRELRQQPTASVAEDRRRRKTLDELDEHIIQHHSHLAETLRLSPAEQLFQPIQPQPQNEDPKDSKDTGPIEPSPPPSLDTTLLASASAGLLTSTENRQPTVEVSLRESVQLIAEQLSVPLVTNGAGSPAAAEEPPATSLVSVVLLSPQEVATLLQCEDCEDNWHTLLWACIDADDLPMAYWLARSLQAGGRACPVPDWLLAA